MTEAGPAGPRPSLAAKALRAAPPLLLAAACAALAIRVAGRDAWRPLAPLFYASPLAAVCGACLAATLLAAGQGRRRLALAGAAVLAVSSVWFVRNEVRPAAPPDPAAPQRAPIRAVLWNTQHGRRGWDGQAASLASSDPDLVVLVEGPEDPEEIDVWARAFPGHRPLHLPGSAFLLARGEVRRVLHWPEPPDEPDDAPAVHAEVLGRSLRLVIADVPSNPLRRRGPWLSRFLDRVTRSGDPRVLVLGDFNTPRDSAHFDAWRGPLRSAFEVAGEGYGATWPVPLPVLSLDQVWAGPGIDLVRCTTKWTWESDHLPVAFEFDVRE